MYTFCCYFCCRLCVSYTQGMCGPSFLHVCMKWDEMREMDVLRFSSPVSSHSLVLCTFVNESHKISWDKKETKKEVAEGYFKMEWSWRSVYALCKGQERKEGTVGEWLWFWRKKKIKKVGARRNVSYDTQKRFLSSYIFLTVWYRQPLFLVDGSFYDSTSRSFSWEDTAKKDINCIRWWSFLSPLFSHLLFSISTPPFLVSISPAVSYIKKWNASLILYEWEETDRKRAT